MTISLAAEPIFHIGTFPITNTLITSWIASALLITLAVFLKRSLRESPRGFQNIAESIMEQILSLMDGVTGARKQTKKFLPLVATLFFFVVTANWLGLLPGVGTIGLLGEHDGYPTIIPFLRSTNTDLNVTLALAIISVLITQAFGIAAVGLAKYSRRFLNFKNPVLTFVGLVEGLSELAKFISFSFRLFGNIFAGEVLLVVISSLVPYIIPVPFYLLELFVGFIQAFIFATLTLVFLKVATVESHGSHH